jgi:starch-binding outer membrane protein SusE/F
MRKLINQLFLLGMASLLVVSCKKDETKSVLDVGTAPTLSSNAAAALVLDKPDADKPAVTFNWSEVSYGYKAAVTYYIQIDKKGNNFASPVEVNVGNSTSKTFLVGNFNKELLKVVTGGVPSDVDFRVKSDIGAGIPPLFSNVISIKVTPYRDIVDYPSLWVAGNFQGWDPPTAPKIASRNGDGIYEGFININNASPEFKLVKGPAWSAGDYGANGAGLGNGGPNLTIATGAGYYRIRANVNNFTWSATKFNWAVIGAATPGGWGTDTPMTFDAVTGQWKITLNLGADEFKFRANNTWDAGFNFGDNGGDFVPDYGGDNIKVPVAGNYTITLDLSIAGNYNYILKKN